MHLLNNVVKLCQLCHSNNLNLSNFMQNLNILVSHSEWRAFSALSFISVLDAAVHVERNLLSSFSKSILSGRECSPQFSPHLLVWPPAPTCSSRQESAASLLAAFFYFSKQPSPNQWEQVVSNTLFLPLLELRRTFHEWGEDFTYHYLSKVDKLEPPRTLVGYPVKLGCC